MFVYYYCSAIKLIIIITFGGVVQTAHNLVVVPQETPRPILQGTLQQCNSKKEENNIVQHRERKTKQKRENTQDSSAMGKAKGGGGRVHICLP